MLKEKITYLCSVTVILFAWPFSAYSSPRNLLAKCCGVCVLQYHAIVSANSPKSCIAAASPLAAGSCCSGAHVGEESFPGHVAVRMEQKKPSGRWVLLLHPPSASQVNPIHATCPTTPHQELQCSTTEQA